MLKEFIYIPPVIKSTKAAMDESLRDIFLDEKSNKQFSFEKWKKKLDGSCISFCSGRTRTGYFQNLTETKWLQLSVSSLSACEFLDAAEVFTCQNFRD